MAIEHGIYPERIYQGSSGSYFVKNTAGVSNANQNDFSLEIICLVVFELTKFANEILAVRKRDENKQLKNVNVWLPI